MDNVINTGLLRQPLNWFVVWSMLFVWWFLFEAITRAPSTDDTSTN